MVRGWSKPLAPVEIGHDRLARHRDRAAARTGIWCAKHEPVARWQIAQ